MKSALIFLLGVCFVNCQFPVKEGQVKDHIDVPAEKFQRVTYDYEYTAPDGQLIKKVIFESMSPFAPVLYKVVEGGCGQKSIKIKLSSLPSRDINYDILVIPGPPPKGHLKNIGLFPNICFVNGATLYDHKPIKEENGYEEFFKDDK